MRLKPDDVLQKGDVIHFGHNDTLVVDGLAGEHVGEMAPAYVERPSSMSDADKVRVLREALEHIQNCCDKHGSKVGWYYDFGEYARAALSATE
jgi:hypothetical protein